MSGDSACFSRTEAPVDSVCNPAGDVQELTLARSLPVAYACLNHVTLAVKLMRFLQILPAALRMFQNKVGIQVSVVKLGFPDRINHAVHSGFQRRIGADRQRIGSRFNPFAHVAVLKNSPVKFSFGFSCCNPKILKRMAFFNAGNPVVQDLFLIRNCNLNHSILNRGEKFIPYRNLFQWNRDRILLYHNCSSYVLSGCTAVVSSAAFQSDGLVWGSKL